MEIKEAIKFLSQLRDMGYRVVSAKQCRFFGWKLSPLCKIEYKDKKALLDLIKSVDDSLDIEKWLEMTRRLAQWGNFPEWDTDGDLLRVY